MGFKYTDRVYKDVRSTSGTEQAVLALLAHFADDKTGQCFPAINTLAEQTRLNRATVFRILDSLKEKGLVKWITGGRQKNGRAVSNLYKIVLPKSTPKSVDKVVFASWNDDIPDEGRVAQCDPHPSQCATPPRRTVRPLPVAQRDPSPSQSATLSYIGSSIGSSNDHPSGHHPPKAEEMPG